MKYYQQHDETDCGAACLAMIASSFGIHTSVTTVRQLAGTDTKGTNLEGMNLAAQKMHLKAKVLKGSEEALSPQLPVPFIAHMSIATDFGAMLHYVVVKKITTKHIYIADPNPQKKCYRCTRNDFCQMWTGYVLFFSPLENTLENKKDSGNLLLKFLPLLRFHTSPLVLSGIASLILIIFGILSSFYYRYIIDEVIFSNAKFTLAALSVGIIIVVILQAVMGAIRSFLLTNFAYKADLQLVFSYFGHVLRLPLTFFDSRKTGEIISRFEDTSKIRDALSQTAVSVVMDTLMILIVGPVLFSIDGTLFLIVVLTVPFISIILFIYSKFYRKQYAALMSEAADVQSFLVETINGISTVKSLNAESLTFSNYESRQMKPTWTGWKAARLTIIQTMTTETIRQISSVILFWVGSNLIIKGNLSIGTLISFNALAVYFTSPLERLVNLQSNLQEAFVAARRLGEILELEQEQASSTNLLKPENILGNIRFSNLQFRYGTRNYVYENLSLTISAGDCIAFVGTSGCGKSTLAKLLLKFYSPNGGNIFLDDIDLQDIDTNYLRSKIGYVSQEICLFSGTIAENIALHAPNTSMEEIVEIAKKTGCHQFISLLPNRYHTVINERGSSLSGGEKQRLALARALLGNPSILILDEATSNLDATSEREIQHTIRNLQRNGMTVILIAHRLTTVVECDRIFVLDTGNIVQVGKHSELISADGLYKKMWYGDI